MADAIHDNVRSIPSGVQLVAGYVTGSPDIQWTAADWALFPGIPHVTIDQGFTGSPVPSAIVRDVETGAWGAGAAVTERPWTPPRPTIYCNQSTLASVTGAGWRGDLWVAIIGWQPGQPWPAPVQAAVNLGCTVVAVQNQQNVNGLYDLSVVLNPDWPEEAPVAVIQAHDGWAYCVKCAGMFFTNGQSTNGVCPAGGPHQHNADAGFDYQILHL